jgi:hypothetical protein
VFLRVSVRVTELPTSTVPSGELGPSRARAAGGSPVPVRFQVRGPPGFALTVRVADLAPADVGSKRMIAVQDSPGCRTGLPLQTLLASTENWLAFVP